jgi:asparagine synthase (glutamine-hydrolysing)
MSAISLLYDRADRWKHNRQELSGLHRAVVSALHQYGPQARSAECDGRVALGINILSSLPEERFDRQPVWSPDRSACLVADARLDNRAELARELDLAHPEELSDSFFLMAAWLRWGAACVDHLIGGFAFAVWTPAAQEVFAARDHAGERPLFYYCSEQLFALASVTAGLLALPISHELQESYAADWLGSLKPDWPSTFFEQIRRLLPGHWLRVTPRSFETREYWHPAKVKPLRLRNDEEYGEALLEIFDRATKARLRTTKQVGSFLSAGLDSSSVTASAARLLSREGKSLPAFTSVPRPGFNGAAPRGYFTSEAEGAARVAALYPNIEHILVNSGEYEFLRTMQRWIDVLHEPTPAPVNMLWLSAIFDRARARGIGVMLEGVEGNGTFSYNTWRPLAQFLRTGRWITLAQTIRGLNRSGALRISSAIRLTASDLTPGWLTRMRVPAEERKSVLACLANPAWMRRYDLERRTLATFYPSSSTVAKEHSALFEGFDQGAFRAAVEAATGIELRDPTADKRLFEFSYAIPPEQFLAGGLSRSLARRAMKGRLPAENLNTTIRGLQGADWHSIIGGSLQELRSELELLRASPEASTALDLSAIEQLLAEWPTGEFQAIEVYARWHFWLARAISMGYFLRTHSPARERGALAADAQASAAALN